MGSKESETELDEIAERFERACESGDVETVEETLNAGKFHVDKPLGLKWSGLQIACYYGKTEVAKFLLAKGADPKFKRKNDGMNVLHAAACSPFPEYYGAYDCCKLILEAGGKVRDTMSNNKTPLIFAVKRCHHKMITLLLENGSNINHQDSTTRTALDWACFKGYTEIVEILLNLGADVTIRNKQGWTAEEVAYYGDHGDIVELFEKFLASPSPVNKLNAAVDISDCENSESNSILLLKNYRQIRAKERNYLNLVLHIENLGKYFDLFQNNHINYSRFLKMTEADLKDVGIMDESDRRLILDLIKNLNKGVEHSPKNSRPVPLYDELTNNMKNRDAHFQLMTNNKKLDEFTQVVHEDPSNLQSGKEKKLGKEFSHSLKIFERKCTKEMETTPQPLVSLTNATTGSSIRAILRLSALAGIVITLTFFAKNLSK